MFYGVILSEREHLRSTALGWSSPWAGPQSNKCVELDILLLPVVDVLLVSGTVQNLLNKVPSTAVMDLLISHFMIFLV